MISSWDFQEQGMEVTKKTPIYFAKQGHYAKLFVYLEQIANLAKIDNLHLNITVYRFDLPLKFLSKIPKLNRILYSTQKKVVLQVANVVIMCNFLSTVEYLKKRREEIIIREYNLAYNELLIEQLKICSIIKVLIRWLPGTLW